MNSETLTRNAIRIVLILIGCVTFGYGQVPQPKSNISETNELVASNNLRQLVVCLRNVMGDSDHFPGSFADINIPVSPSLFICPGTGNKPGSILSVEQWTDYIYVGNNTEDAPNAALIISPPENHNGKYGLVVCADGACFQLPPDRVRDIVNEPWLLATNSPMAILDKLKSEVVVHVPERLKKSYPQAYTSRKLMLVPLNTGDSGNISYGLYCMTCVPRIYSNGPVEIGGDLVLIMRNTGAKSINMNGVTVENFKLLDASGRNIKCYLWTTPRTMGFGDSTVIHIVVDHYSDAIQPWALSFKSKPDAFVPINLTIKDIAPMKGLKQTR